MPLNELADDVWGYMLLSMQYSCFTCVYVCSILMFYKVMNLVLHDRNSHLNSIDLYSNYIVFLINVKLLSFGLVYNIWVFKYQAEEYSTQ